MGRAHGQAPRRGSDVDAVAVPRRAGAPPRARIPRRRLDGVDRAGPGGARILSATGLRLRRQPRHRRPPARTTTGPRHHAAHLVGARRCPYRPVGRRGVAHGPLVASRTGLTSAAQADADPARVRSGQAGWVVDSAAAASDAATEWSISTSGASWARSTT